MGSAPGHNKKRNAGLLYEFLVKAISCGLVEGDERRAARSLKLMKRFFRPGTELHRELRLVSSLVRTTVSSEAIAAGIVREARDAARSHDVAALDREKSLLISLVNRTLGDADFFDRPISEYRAYATVQTLLNGWRSGNADIGKQAQYEDQLVSWLVSEKAAPADVVVDAVPLGDRRLLMRTMMRKLNERYAGSLTLEQKQLVRDYALSPGDGTGLKEKLCVLRDRLLQELDAFRARPDAGYVGAKLDQVRKVLLDEQLERVDDDTLVRFMLYVKLSEELTGEDT